MGVNWEVAKCQVLALLQEYSTPLRFSVLLNEKVTDVTVGKSPAYAGRVL